MATLALEDAMKIGDRVRVFLPHLGYRNGVIALVDGSMIHVDFGDFFEWVRADSAS